MKGSGMEALSRDLVTLFSVGTIGGLSDGQLLGRFVERREADAFVALMHRHGPMVWGVCRRVLRDGHDAEDAFQASFLVLARKAASVQPREKLGNWLYGVAYQTARKAKAMRDKRRGRERQGSDLSEPLAVPDGPKSDLTEDLDRELARLPEKYRIPIVLCELEGKSHADAARQLGWPVGTVSSRLSRAKTLLARRLSRPGMTLAVGSLTVLLARDVASASVPTRLVGSTADAASLIAAGGVAAGVVSAEVAALTGEVMKAMLMTKIGVLTVMLVGVSLPVGWVGASLTAGGSLGGPTAKADAASVRGHEAESRGELPGRIPFRGDGRDFRVETKYLELAFEQGLGSFTFPNRDSAGRSDARDQQEKGLEQRLKGVEEKLDRILKELEGLRKHPQAARRELVTYHIGAFW